MQLTSSLLLQNAGHDAISMTKLRPQGPSGKVSPLPNGTSHEGPNGIAIATNNIEGLPTSHSVTEGQVNGGFMADGQNCVNRAATNFNHNSGISPNSNSNSSTGGHVEITDENVHNGGVRPISEPVASITDNESINSSALNPGADNANPTSQQQTRLHNDMNVGSERPPPYKSTASLTSTPINSQSTKVPETPNGNAKSGTEEGEFDGELHEKVNDPPSTKPIFSPLLVLTAMTGSFAHGGNDVRCVNRSTLQRVSVSSF